MRVAYFVNQYPKVSHSFIRREILALEGLGVEVCRIALRGWDADLVDMTDISERELTRYVLKSGLKSLLVPAFRCFIGSPGKFFAALRLALKLGSRADRPLPFHIIYLLEACQVSLWMQKIGIQHLHAHFGTNSAELAMLSHELNGIPYSFTVHGPEEFDKPEFIKLTEKIRRAAFVVAISSFGRSQLYRWLDHAEWPKIKVVHCALEQSFHDVAWQALPATPRLVCVGRLSEQKGQLLLLQAAAALHEKGCEFELVLAGDGEMRGVIEDFIVTHNLLNQVRITGWISSDQVREEILAAKALVMPSFAEGLPVVIMEAMALRRPVLTTYVAGIPELVLAGETGWLFPAGSVEDLTLAIEDCLASAPEKLQRMGELGYQRAMLRHSIDTEAAKLYALFAESIAISGLPD